MSKSSSPGLTLEKTWAAGTVVCEPQINPTLFVVMGPGETEGTVLLAPLNTLKRRNRALWYYAFTEDLEEVGTKEGRSLWR